MPAGKEGGSKEDRRGSSTVKRETFRPPWVKEGPDGLPPKPSNLWSKTRQTSKDGPAPEATPASKRSSIVKASEDCPQENGTASKEHTFVKPQLKPVPPKEPKMQPREVKIPIKLNSVKDLPPLNKTNSMNREDANIDKAIPTERNAIMRQESLKKMTAPKAPPMPPPAPAIPRPPDLKPLSINQLSQLEQLKARPKVRPDWTAMLKDIEGGRKLKHVQCNDRSKPLLPKEKVKETDKEQFIYESEKNEKDTSHNQLLKEIQQGVALKRVKTNDRSKPVLEGLRKFRRQMTIEEQIIKSQSMASIPPEEIADEADELDDIDKVRDDLQSTKQMLALELRNKEALNRDNKRLQTRIAQLEAELEKEKANKKSVPVINAEADEKLVTSLKSEAADARKVAQDLEIKYHEAANQLDNTKSELEEVRKQKQALEKKLIESVQGGKRLSLSDRKDSVVESDLEEEQEEESESGESDNEEKREKKAQREIKQLRCKLRGYKNKEDNAKKERMALKNQIKKLHEAMKNEKKKYKGLQKEVVKMDAMLKEVSGDSDEEDDDEEKAKKAENEESEAETETESETESSETDSESEKSMSEPEDAPNDKKKDNLTKRTRKHEGRLSALKKGNYMLKTNVERLQDDLNKQKEESIELQQELDSVLSELG